MDTKTFIVARVQTTVVYIEVDAVSGFEAEKLAREGEGLQIRGPHSNGAQYFCVPRVPQIEEKETL